MTSPSDFSGETFDFAQGSVFGFRRWYMRVTPLMYHYEIALLGATEELWRYRDMTAYCKRGYSEHPRADAPNQECTCGIYAYWSPRGTNMRVMGVIEGSGKTIIGDLGFRTQYARIKALSWGYGMTEQVAYALEGKYGVPVYYGFEEMLADFPLTTDYLNTKELQ